MLKCPNCEQEGAYIGATTIECYNRDCKYFTEKQFNAALKEFADELEELTDEEREELQREDGGQISFDFDWTGFFGFVSGSDNVSLYSSSIEDFNKALEVLSRKWTK